MVRRVTRYALVVLAVGIVTVLTACASSKTAATHPTQTSKGRPTATTKTVTVTAPVNATPITIPCVDETTGRTDFVSAPVNCDMHPGREGEGHASLLKDLTWRDWGESEASATGDEIWGGTGGATLPSYPAHVLVYALVGQHYTRAKVTAKGVTVVQKLGELPVEPPPESAQTTPTHHQEVVKAREHEEEVEEQRVKEGKPSLAVERAGRNLERKSEEIEALKQRQVEECRRKPHTLDCEMERAKAK